MNISAIMRGMPNTLDLRGLQRMAEPAHQVLAKFIHECSQDPATRTVATTALVVSIWQLAGRALTPDQPSMLLVNAGEASDDPIDAFVRFLVSDPEANRPRMQREGPFAFVQPDQAPVSMANALRQHRALGRDLQDKPHSRARAEVLEERYHAAQITGYGTGCSRPYAQAWHEEFGLLTGRDDQLILRLDGKDDRAAFRKDLLNDPCKLAFPEGIGGDLATVPKHVSLSGSLTGEACDWRIAREITTLGLPLFFLPHTAAEPLVPGNLPAFGGLAMMWPRRTGPPVETSLRMPPSPWIRAYQDALRKRLANLPAGYEFAVLQAVHQLDGICHRIARFAGTGTGAKQEEIIALFLDLYGQTLRGMVIGVASLSWHGLGLCLGPECERLRDKALKLLKTLRTKGPVSCNDLLKNFHLAKAERDPLLERLAGECLVRVERGQVTATTRREFVEALYLRKEFPQAQNHWAEVAGQDKAAAKKHGRKRKDG